MRTQGKIGG